MGRPKEFDRDAVLDTAIEVFRRQGYEATSIQDLVGQMGIHRASLYDTFGDKQGLYLAALDRYDAKNFAEKSAFFRSHLTLREAVRRVYQDIIDELMSTGGVSFGCLITNSSVERAMVDPASANRAARNWERFVSLYEAALHRARETGEIRAEKSDAELRALAHFIAGVARGLRITAKSTCCRATLEDIARIALKALDQ